MAWALTRAGGTALGLGRWPGSPTRSLPPASLQPQGFHLASKRALPLQNWEKEAFLVCLS